MLKSTVITVEIVIFLLTKFSLKYLKKRNAFHCLFFWIMWKIAWLFLVRPYYLTRLRFAIQSCWVTQLDDTNVIDVWLVYHFYNLVTNRFVDWKQSRRWYIPRTMLSSDRLRYLQGGHRAGIARWQHLCRQARQGHLWWRLQAIQSLRRYGRQQVHCRSVCRQTFHSLLLGTDFGHLLVELYSSCEWF